MKQTKTEWIKRLFRQELTTQEEAELLAGKEIRSRMYAQWEHSGSEHDPEYEADCERRIWKRVERAIQQKEQRVARGYWRWYSVASTFLLLVSLSITGYLSTGSPVEMNYVAHTGIQNIESIVLPDGTFVQLGAGSRLTYPAKFTGETRTVEVDGQAFFDVNPDPDRPFIVKTAKMDVTALGTAFEVFCYDGEQHQETVLLHGKVKVDMSLSAAGKESPQSIILTPDQKLSLNSRTGEVEVNPVDADKYTEWRERRVLSFQNEKLSMILPRLEKWYGRHLMCSRELSEEYRFTFKVRDESLERILYIISESSDLKYQKRNEGFEIVKQK